ncbi:MAG: STAS domain-containing protein [Gammaproteobacteria bacterium]
MGQPGFSDLGGGRFALAGDLVFDTVPGLLALGDAAFAASARAEVDLARIGRIDSAGVALLLEWVIAARGAGRELRYRHPPPALAVLAGLGEVGALIGADAAG